MKPLKIVTNLLLFCLLSSISFGQSLKPLAREVQKKHQQKATFTKIDDLLQVQQSNSLTTLVEKEVRNAQIFSYDVALASEIINNRYQALTFDIELDNELKTIEVVLVKQSFHDYIVSSSSGAIPETNSGRGIHYRGIVLGDENSSLVALSIFNNQLIGVISINDEGDYNIGKLKDHEYHVIYNEADLQESPSFECFSDLNQVENYTESTISGAKSNNPEDHCIDVYFEVDNEIYVNEGSSLPNTAAFVIGLFNQTAAIYQNESITVQISEIIIWDTPDPYHNTDIISAIIQFENANPTFNGDLAQLLEFSPSGGGGIAYNIGGILCGDTSAGLPYAASSMFPEFEIVPLYSRQVKVLTHEMGHNLNSFHTHRCVWNGNGTTFDDYGNYYNNGTFIPGSEGASCVDQANPRLSETPTIMSYFDSNLHGTFPMSNGFGDQPGDVIRAAVVNAYCLTLCTDCNTTITSLPYSESFETGLGDWEQSTTDAFDWVRNSGSTPSMNSGPSNAADGSFYMYFESSSPNNTDGRTILNSPCFDLSNKKGINLSFAYHMYGQNMDTLLLEVSTDEGVTWTTEWFENGNRGDQWLTENINLHAYSGSTIQLRFIAGGSGYGDLTDMAIDDIVLTEATPIATFPYTESFEIDFGGWNHVDTDDFNWIRKSGPTSSSGTGPFSATEGNYYMYVEASYPNYPTKTTILESPCFDLTGQNNMELNFAYHMFGSSMGTLDVQVSNDGGTTWVSEWTLSGDQGNSWSRVNVDLSAYANDLISIRYVGTTSTSYRGDVAIDDINMRDALCPAVVNFFPYSESFESGLGNWNQSADDDLDWTRKSGSTPSTNTGPTSASDGTFYMYIEASGGNFPSKTTILVGPCFNLNGQLGTNLSFDYHMYGSSVGNLDLQVSSNGGSTWTSVWSLSGDQGNQWLTANVNLDAYAGGIIQLRYVGTTSFSFRGDISIDDISLNTNGNANDEQIELLGSLENSQTIEVYPNPANDYAIIDFSGLDSYEVSVSIIDMLGKEVYGINMNDEDDTSLRVLTNNFAPGFYMVEVRSNTGQMFNKRLVISD